MRVLPSLTYVAAMLLHMWLGNCAHHHPVDEEHVASPVHCHSHAGHSHGYRHVDADSLASEKAPHWPEKSHDDCHETHCTFVAAGKVTFVPEVVVAPLPPLEAEAAVSRSIAAHVCWHADTGDLVALPVRLHLFHRILVI